MKKVAGFHSLDLGCDCDLGLRSRFRRNLGIMEVQTEVLVTRGRELDGRACWWKGGGGLSRGRRRSER